MHNFGISVDKLASRYHLQEREREREKEIERTYMYFVVLQKQ